MLPRITWQTIPRVHLIVYSNTYIFLKIIWGWFKSWEFCKSSRCYCYEGVFVLNLWSYSLPLHLDAGSIFYCSIWMTYAYPTIWTLDLERNQEVPSSNTCHSTVSLCLVSLKRCKKKALGKQQKVFQTPCRRIPCEISWTINCLQWSSCLYRCVNFHPWRS